MRPFARTRNGFKKALGLAVTLLGLLVALKAMPAWFWIMASGMVLMGVGWAMLRSD